MQVIWVRRESEYFCKRGWTGQANHQTARPDKSRHRAATANRNNHVTSSFGLGMNRRGDLARSRNKVELLGCAVRKDSEVLGLLAILYF